MKQCEILHKVLFINTWLLKRRIEFLENSLRSEKKSAEEPLVCYRLATERLDSGNVLCFYRSIKFFVLIMNIVLPLIHEKKSVGCYPVASSP
jgi:hypothetical protein